MKFSQEELKFFSNIKSLQSLQDKNVKLELEKVLNQISGLAFSEYKSFLSNLKTVKSASQDLSLLHGDVSSLQEELKRLELNFKNVESYGQMAGSLSLLNRNQQVLSEILTLQTRIDNLAKNSNYDEAIQLIVWVNSVLRKRFNYNIVSDLVKQVDDSTLKIINRLISGLAGQLNLANAIKTLGYLKRLGIDSDVELKTLFLRSRGQYLEIMVARVEVADVKKLLEVHRGVFFDILTMYHAIFIEYSQEKKVQDSLMLLSSWSSLVLTEFFNMIRNRIQDYREISLISSIQTQSMYYGMSLGRMGLDFRFWITDFFEEITLDLIFETLESGTETFLQRLEDGNWKSRISHDTEILNVPCVALLFNSFTTCLNQIRLLPLLNNRSRVLKALKENVEKQISAIEKLGLVSMNDWQESVLLDFEYLCYLYTQILGPQVLSSFEKVYKIKLDNYFSSELLSTWTRST
jgi:hypothetical protein